MLSLGAGEVAGKKTDCIRCLHLLEFSERNKKERRRPRKLCRAAASREQREEQGQTFMRHHHSLSGSHSALPIILWGKELHQPI